jgi:hypothetical protein
VLPYFPRSPVGNAGQPQVLAPQENRGSDRARPRRQRVICLFRLAVRIGDRASATLISIIVSLRRKS